MTVTLTSNEEIDLAMITLVNKELFTLLFLLKIRDDEKKEDEYSTSFTVKSIQKAKEEDFFFIRKLTKKEDQEVRNSLSCYFVFEAVSIKPSSFDVRYELHVKPVSYCKGILRIDERSDQILGYVTTFTHRPVPCATKNN